MAASVPSLPVNLTNTKEVTEYNVSSPLDLPTSSRDNTLTTVAFLTRNDPSEPSLSADATALLHRATLTQIDRRLASHSEAEMVSPAVTPLSHASPEAALALRGILKPIMVRPASYANEDELYSESIALGNKRSPSSLSACRRLSRSTHRHTLSPLDSDELAGPSNRSDPEMSGSDGEPVASETSSEIDFGNELGVVDTDIELEGIIPDNASQHTFGWEQCTDWDVVHPNERRQEAGSPLTIASDEDDDFDESGFRGFAAIRRSSISVQLASAWDRSFHTSSDIMPTQSNIRQREDSTTTVRRPSYNNTEGDAPVTVTSSNRAQQPLLPPANWTMFANNSGVSSSDHSGERVYEGMDLDYILNVENLEGRDPRRSSLSFLAQPLPLPPSRDKQTSRGEEKRKEGEEMGKHEGLDVTALRKLIGPSRESSNLQDVAPWAEASDTTDSPRPSTVRSDESFGGGLRRDDPDYALRRKEWSFIRERERVSRPTREPDGNPRHWDVWRHYQIGQIRIEQVALPHSDPNKPNQERLNAEHDVDPDSANTLGGPTSVVHRHSRAFAFSIYRHYNPKLYRSSKTRNTTTTVSAQTPRSSEPPHDPIFLATKRVQKHFTTTRTTAKLNTHGLLPEEGDNRRDSRRALSLSHRRPPQDWSRREPPASRRIVDLSRLEELDDQTLSLRPDTPSHISGSLDLSGSTAFASSTPTSLSLSSTASVALFSETSSISERQPSPHEEVEEEESDDDIEKPVPRASHAEAFATLDKRAIDQLKNELVPAPTTRRSQGFFQRFINPTGGSTTRTPSSSLAPIKPAWPTLAPRPMQEEQDRVIQLLRSSFKDVGFGPSTSRSKSGAHTRRKSKDKGKDMLTQVPDDSLYMLLPLWPHETDPASAARERREPSPRVNQQNLYLLVYYVPFDKPGEVNPVKKGSQLRPREGERKRQPRPTPLFDARRGFKIVGRLITHSDLNGAGIRLPVRGLSVAGSLAEAELGIPPASRRDVHSVDLVIGACLDRHGTSIEFFPEGLEKLGLCVPRADPPVQLHTHPGMQTADPVDEDVVLQPLTAIGRAVVEIAWLGCMALMVFYGPQAQGPA